MKNAQTRPMMSCDTCRFRKIAEDSPSSLTGRLWIWHTAFCPGWKRYLKAIHAHNETPPAVGHRRGMWGK